MAVPPGKPARRALRVTSRYEVGELLASGGMGSVYRAFDRLAQRPVAYKRLNIEDESARSRFSALFRHEYDTLAHLAHPNIVEAYEFGFDARGPFYTMELLSGRDLAQAAPLSVSEACRILRDIASALALLHARRLVHRDVSPSNVRLTTDGQAKLIDFGALVPFGTTTGVVGTPAFIAPECLTGAALDARTDLYALGVLAYWTLTRRLCVQAKTIEGLREAWKAQIAPPSRYAPAIPPALDELVLTLLRREPVARPESAAEVIERLTNLCDLPPERDEARVAYSYLRHPPLRGREQILGELRHALRRAAVGRGQLVLLSAEQGLGRSALLGQLAVEAQLAGATVLRAQGGLHRGPFGAARALVEAGLSISPDPPGLGDDGADRERAGDEDEKTAVRSTIDQSERQAHRATRLQHALLALSKQNPLVVLVDDAHALDAESLSLFASIIEELREHPILLAFSARAGARTEHPQAFAKLEANAERCKLTALSEQQVLELVTTMFGGVRNSRHLATWLYEQTGGNPGQCMDLARLLLARGAIRYSVGTFTLPHAFAGTAASALHTEALLAQLSGLTPQAERVAHLLGLQLGPLTSAQLADAGAGSEREVLLALQELMRCGLVVDSGDGYSCASEALRAALTSWRSPAETRDAHLTLARVLAQEDQNLLEHRLATARHLLQAGGDEAYEGACLLAQTGDEHKFSIAMSRPARLLFEQALELLEARGVRDEESVGLLIPLASAGFYGELDAQRRYLERTLRALARMCGITLAQRLRPWFGPRLALVFGALVAAFVHLLRPKPINRRTFMQLFESFGGLPGAAGAAAACVWDTHECERLAAWLEPFAFASKRGALYVMREFCLATAELVAAKLSASAERYARLLATLERPVLGLDALHAEQFRCGCLHGQAQGLVTNTDPRALEVADELARRSTFFAPHAESVRMTYHAFRGEAEQAAGHRERAEALAFRGGTSWSATSLLTIRSVQACMMTGDAIGMMHVVADLAQLAQLSDSMAAIYELAQAHLEQLQGHPERAVVVYERVLPTEAARNLPSYPAERSLHAQALSALGDYAQAKALCVALIDELEGTRGDADAVYLITRQQLALAEAGLGDYRRAAELLESCFPYAGRHGNPLALGTVHRDRAYVAARAGDVGTFERHFEAMAAHFRATRNPKLIQQCEALRAEAVRLGVVSAPAPDPRLEADLHSGTSAETANTVETGRPLDEVS